MQNKIERKYENRFNQICKKWHEEKNVEGLIKQWYQKLLHVYSISNNFIHQTPIEEYLNTYLNALEKLNVIDVCTLESVLNSPYNIFYEEIRKIPLGMEIVSTKRIKKENGKYYLSTYGEYCILNMGLSNVRQSWIGIIEDETILENFHHELTHIVQGIKRYKYPSYFPFSFAMNHIIREGDAQYNERIFSGELYSNYKCWNEDLIDNNVFICEIYFQMYVMLMLCLPKTFREKWSNEEFDISLFSKELYQNYINLFGIMSLLAAKIFSKNIQNDFLGEINRLKDYERIKIDVETNYKNEYQRLENEIQNLKSLLQKETEKSILEEEYRKYLSEEIKEKEAEKITKYSFKNQEILRLEFGKDLINVIKYYIDKNFTIQKLFEQISQTVNNILLEQGVNIELISNILFRENDLKK